MNDIVNEPGIKFMDRNPPVFTVEEGGTIAEERFGLVGRLTPLVSERDQNFRLSTEGGDYVLKLSNAEEDPGVIDFQTKGLLHIAEQDPDLGVPRVKYSRGGEVIEWVEARSGSRHMARVVTFLPGLVLDDVAHTSGLLNHIGATMARLDVALRGFFHPHARNPHPWDVTRAADMRPPARHIEDARARRQVEAILDHFSGDLGRRLRRLRHQVVHNDATRDNLVVDPANRDRIAGILDFGDMVHAPLLCELAMSIDSLMYDYDDPVVPAEQVALGFDSVIALEEDEVDLLYDTIMTRQAIAAIIIAWRKAVTPHQPGYLLEHEKPQWRVIDRLTTMGRTRFRDRLRRTLHFPVHCPIGRVDTPEASDLAPLLERRRHVLGKSLSLFYDQPLHIERGRGAMLYDANGRAFIDAYNNVPSVGHCHPHVQRAIARQAAALATNTRYVYSNILEYAERLGDTMPGDLKACIFVNSGSEANDIAWRICTMLTGHRGGIIMEHAYHGITEAIAALSPHHPTELAPHIRTLMSPDPYRGLYGSGEADIAEKYAADADRAIAELVATGHGTACFMVDSSFCSNGIPDVPAGYLPAVAKKVRKAGGLIVGDEVQYGFGRPGTHLWGFDYHGMLPDIVTLGKPVGGGFPLGVVITTPAILEEFGRATGLFSTFGGNPVACAAGLAVLDVIEREDLMQRAKMTGEHLREGLRGLMQKYAPIGDVRGHGLIAGVEVVMDRESKRPAPELMKRIMNRMRELGVLTGREGHFGNVFKIRPPLAFGPEHADRLVAVMDQAFAEQ